MRNPSFVVLITLLCAVAAIGQSKVDRDFTKFLDKMDAAQVELQNGDAAAYKDLWSKADDVTLSGGFGGKVEKGWTAVSGRLDWAASQFKNGKNRIERLSVRSDNKLAYAVQLEHIEFLSPSGEPTVKDYRVTLIFRKEGGKWRMIHRHADGQNVKTGA